MTYEEDFAIHRSRWEQEDLEREAAQDLAEEKERLMLLHHLEDRASGRRPERGGQ